MYRPPKQKRNFAQHKLETRFFFLRERRPVVQNLTIGRHDLGAAGRGRKKAEAQKSKNGGFEIAPDGRLIIKDSDDEEEATTSAEAKTEDGKDKNKGGKASAEVDETR